MAVVREAGRDAALSPLEAVASRAVGRVDQVHAAARGGLIPVRDFAHVFEHYAGEAFVAQALADPPVDTALLALAHKRLEEVDRTVDGGQLDAVLRRLFDPRERDLLTVSAFSSAL